MSADTKLYLLAPPDAAPETFAPVLAEALDAGPIACVRLRYPTAQADAIRRAIETLRPIAQSRDVAILIEDYYKLAAEGGLDGVHFAAASFPAEAREALDEDAIIGVGCGASRHRGLVAGERGVDYVAFGPIAADPALHAGDLADADLFAWWQQMIELPVVAEGGVDTEAAARLSGLADFIAVDDAVWRCPDGPAAGVRSLRRALDGAD